MFEKVKPFILHIAQAICIDMLLIHIVLAATAIPVFTEFEPNNTPQQAMGFSAPAILSGSMISGDQDAYLWHISDADSLKLWDLTLHGIPGALTGVSIIRVKMGTADDLTQSNANNAILGYETLLTFGIRDGSRPVSKQNLFLPAGDYIVGFFQAGSKKGFQPPNISSMIDFPKGRKVNDTLETNNAYRFVIKSGLKVSYETNAQNQAKKTSAEIRLGNSYNTHTSLLGGESWYSITVDEKNAKSLWTIKGGVMLERKIALSLYDDKGKKLGDEKSDKYGHFTLPNLALKQGQYYVKLHDDDKEPASRSLRIIETGLVSEGTELEPNDKWIKANVVDLENPLKSRADKIHEMDYFKLSITEENQEEVFNLSLDSSNIKSITFCLLNSKGKSRSCRAGKPPLILDHLSLNAGTHGLLVSRSSEIGEYTISKSTTGKIKPSLELEPNDQSVDASTFDKKGLIKGTISQQDKDFFTLNIREEPQLWRLQAIGKNLLYLTYHPQHGESTQFVKASSGARRLRLDNLYLLPGTHLFSLTANKDTKYVLRALALGSPSPEMEREPNNSIGTAQRIELGNKKIGLLTETSDSDYYRFHLAAKQIIQLNLIVPPDGTFTLNLYKEGKGLKEFRSIKNEFNRQLNLDPGDYQIRLTARTSSEAEYELSVKQYFGFAEYSDIEPNGNPRNANEIPPSWVLSSHVGDSYHHFDYYRIPRLKKPLLINLHSKKSTPTIKITDDSRASIAQFSKLDPENWRATIPSDKQAYFLINGTGNYRYDIGFDSDDITIKPPLSILPLELEIIEDTDVTIAAYSNFNQTFSLKTKLTNQTTADITATLKIKTTDEKWIAKIETDNIIVPAGKTKSFPIKVLVKPDAWPDTPVTVHLTATNHDSNKASFTTHQLIAKRFTVAKNPHFGFKPPKSLQGSINVASASLGANWMTKSTNYNQYLNDGLVVVSNYFYTTRKTPAGPGLLQPVIQFPGKQASEIIGFSFHLFGTQGGSNSLGDARKVKVELSEDGKEFKTAIITKLSAQTKEQFFPLDKPIIARYARLTLVDGPSEWIALGEWKVLAKPDAIINLDKLNIALPELGGHIVWQSPPQPEHSYYKTLLTEKNDAVVIRVRSANNHQWVVGFNQNRAAFISKVTWKDKKNIGKKRYIKTSLYSSIQSPFGPWRKLGEWKLDGGIKAEMKLKKPVWARFLKFEAEPHPDQKNNGKVYTPDQIEVFESKDENNLSIIGEWGHNSPLGPFEVAYPPLVIAQENTLPANITKDKATQLKPNKQLNNHVRLGKYTNWYRLIVPENQNTIHLELNGYPSIGAQAILFNIEGEKLTWFQQNESLEKTHYEAYVPAAEYYIKVEEPPRSVVFTWDTSGSTKPVRPIIQQAVLRYVADVKPGLDEAQMLPFGGSFLSQRWLDQPYMLQSVLNDYNGSGNSSAAETALVQASEKLRDSKGKKIIVLITDAATTHDNALWDTLKEIRPKIIALGVSSKGALGPDPNTEQDLLQDWAWSSNGYYEYIESIGAAERAFDRASSKIRQPVNYQITGSTEFKQPPKPGFLEVVTSSKKKTASTIKLPAPTIEVILDASGSMFSQMGKQRRYQIASNVLVDLVGKQLPNNTNFGLRVFGHKETGSCRTDLEIPIKRLNRKNAIQKIKKIAPKSYSKTPIAASLLAAAGDLKKIKGEKTILLITDGKETCNGDPEKAIEKLKESGIDTTVNIIGFAINDNALEEKFRRWAKSGGGEYQRALDGDALSINIKKLSSRKFSLTNSKGEVIGSYYTDSSPIELPVGDYQINFSNILTKKITIKQSQTLTVKTRG